MNKGELVTRGIKHWGLSGYLKVMPRIKFVATGQESSPQSPSISYRHLYHQLHQLKMTELEFKDELKQILDKHGITSIHDVTFGFSISSPNYPFLEGADISTLPNQAQFEINELIQRFMKSNS
jgi:hypothetical protein